MKNEIIILRYGELSLKSSYVRKYFESMLLRNIKRALQMEKITYTIQVERGRIFLKTNETQKTSEIVSRIFGIVSLSQAVQTTSSMHDMSRTARQLMQEVLTKGKSFAIRVTRVGSHPFSSQDVAIHLGNDIVTATHASVDLDKPDIELFIEIRENNAFFFTEKIRGTGGLPSGTQGTLGALIDRPVSLLAAWYLLRRGCTMVLINLNKSNDQAISSFLRHWYIDAEIVDIHQQTQLIERISAIATEKNCQAIVTGHSLYARKNPIPFLMNLKKTTGLPLLSPLIAQTDEEIKNNCETKGISL
jgi:thiamine biosynthesis protein ThiI